MGVQSQWNYRTLTAVAAVCLGAHAGLAADEDSELAIADLLKGGWEIAGYTSTVDNRSTFILFRHPQEPYLVQCRSGYDVTREPRVFSNCYALR